MNYQTYMWITPAMINYHCTNYLTMNVISALFIGCSSYLNIVAQKPTDKCWFQSNTSFCLTLKWIKTRTQISLSSSYIIWLAILIDVWRNQFFSLHILKITWSKSHALKIFYKGVIHFCKQTFNDKEEIFIYIYNCCITWIYL